MYLNNRGKGRREEHILVTWEVQVGEGDQGLVVCSDGFAEDSSSIPGTQVTWLTMTSNTSTREFLSPHIHTSKIKQTVR